MANVSDYEGDDDIVQQYENQESNGSFGEAEAETYDNDDELGTAQRIDPSKSKTHVVRNPVPKLNTERLKGPNGIQTIEKYFEGFKFYGKGYEKTDLDRIMKRLEHWSYRLFPKYHFDDFLTRVEQLGTKKDIQVFLKKYRLDMITSDNDVIIQDNTDDEEDQQENALMDDLDLLITEQIQKQKQAEIEVSMPAPSTSNNDAFDQLLMQSDDIPNSQTQTQHATTAKELNDEIKEKIERNKQLAIQRRLQRQKEREEETKRSRLIENINVETSNEISDSISCGEINVSRIDCGQSQIDENGKEASFDKVEELSNEKQVTNHV